MQKKVEGNISGVRNSYVERLKKIYEMQLERKQFCSEEIIETLLFFTEATGREAMVYLDRAGRVETVVVGEQDRVNLPVLRKRRSENRLSGLRCVHTHPIRAGVSARDNAMLSTVDIQSLKNLRLDAMASVGGNFMQVAVLNEITPNEEISVNIFEPFEIKNIPDEFLWNEIEAADMRIRPAESKKSEAEIARAILVGLGDEPLDELKQLADTAGFITLGSVVQSKSRPDKTFYLGYGKLHDLTLEIQKLQADTIIFDDELSPSQIRNIQKELGKKIDIIDRTALILDIFSNRASTHEGRLQVELAQTKYLLPRMTGFWGHFHKMAGGGGGGGGARRGEGETQLEVDRRLLRKRLNELERELEKVKSRREVQRAARERSKIPIVALVGYTNAGKSTLMNSLSGSDVLAEDKLFATLDPKSRRVNYGSGEFLLVDTVGFINKLPHDLINAFRATLEEARFADLLLHVVDSSSDSREKQIKVVNEVLAQLEAHTNPTLNVFNKSDLCETEPVGGMDNISISAKNGDGIENLKNAITKKLSNLRTEISILLPPGAGGIISRVYANGQVHECEYLENGIKLVATVTAEEAARLREICG
ncbi:MAG: GTPase HflX [Defluviitaleaceae bacterium]|nr:GTPase HflX [Defluviitaleaceae bacterium]